MRNTFTSIECSSGIPRQTYRDVVTHPPSREIYGECVAIHGPARTGKTLTAIKIVAQRLMDDYENKICQVVSNIPLNLMQIGCQSKFRYFDDIEIMKEEVPQGRCRIVFIDEMRRLCDSRMSLGQRNRFISNLLADLFKLRNDLIYTDQDMMAVDKRVRINVTYLLFPYFNERTKWCRVLPFQTETDYFNFTEFSITNSFTDNYQYDYYTPTFYKFFDTEGKVETFKLRFKIEEYAQQFLVWARRECGSKPLSSGMVTLWNKIGGENKTDIGLDASETRALWEYLKLHHV